MFKRIDRLVLNGFYPQFIVTFLIALFVFTLQFLWKYVDEIMGKGIDTIVMLELLFYMSVSVVPFALMLSMLIGSVMSLGRLAERYELSSLKSAGVSLLRAMRSLIVVGVLMTGFSFVCNNYLIPVANLKFKSRLYDVRRQKPALSINEGQYNYDFKGYAIYIAQKAKQGSGMKRMKIYDHTTRRGNVNVTAAQSGEMFYSNDTRYLIMRLYNGERYEELPPDPKRPATLPHIRMRFEEYETAFDLKQFDLKLTDENLFKKHHTMLSVRQLVESMDSLTLREQKRTAQIAVNAEPQFYFKRKRKAGIEEGDTVAVTNYAPPAPQALKYALPDSLRPFSLRFGKEEKRSYAARARQAAEGLSNYAASIAEDLRKYGTTRIEHLNEIHRKFSLAAACLIFLFIGAPLGAIIRKGGFGWSIMIAVIGFTVFFVLSLIGEKSSKSGGLPPYIGMWLPCIILTPLGIWFTWKATNDAKLLNTDGWQTAFQWFRFSRKPKPRAHV